MYKTGKRYEIKISSNTPIDWRLDKTRNASLKLRNKYSKKMHPWGTRNLTAHITSFSNGYRKVLPTRKPMYAMFIFGAS